MTGTWALVKEGKVINTIAWDGKSAIEFGDKIIAVECKDDYPVATGFSYVDGDFMSPDPTSEEITQKKIDAVKSNLGTKDSLITNAKSQIMLPQTKLLMGRTLSDAEKISLNEWLDYIDEIVGVDANTDKEISWPLEPSN